MIHLDVQWCCIEAGSAENTVAYIAEKVINELKIEFPQVALFDKATLGGALAQITQETGRKFIIIIIDEWDVLIRDEASNTKVQEEYIDFLSGLFKGIEPTKFLHLAFLTGILPIKKIKKQSALNNFEEFTMLEPDMLSAYIGFTEEVRKLCDSYHRNFAEVKRWYDGYILGDYHVYNPKAVVSIMTRGIFRSYWFQTGTYESILPLINMDFDGLRTAIIQSHANLPRIFCAKTGKSGKDWYIKFTTTFRTAQKFPPACR